MPHEDHIWHALSVVILHSTGCIHWINMVFRPETDTGRKKKKKKKNKTKLLVCYAMNASLLLCFFPLHPPRFSGFCVCLKNRLVIFYLQREFPLPHASSWAQKGHNYCPIFLNYNIVSHVCFTLFLILSNRLKNIYIFFKSITGCSAELTIL